MPHYAVSSRSKEVVELLIAKGTNVDAQDFQARTPLDIALQRNWKEIADLLRKHGAKE